MLASCLRQKLESCPMAQPEIQAVNALLQVALLSPPGSCSAKSNSYKHYHMLCKIL